ncbi:MAG: hypothetical protein KC502_18235 [Myxococcales bacterium]|nr:hypothetical protein [Myxococcales bacterium]
MPSIIAESWSAVGRTSNTAYFAVDPDILVIIPDAGLKDNGDSARENAEFQKAYAKSLPNQCAVVVQMGGLLSQDGEARRVYRDLMDSGHFYGAALVATNAISKAIASFFLGLTRPKVPLKVFGSFEAAIDWHHEMQPGGKQ